jgi:hypothetical protein
MVEDTKRLVAEIESIANGNSPLVQFNGSIVLINRASVAINQTMVAFNGSSVAGNGIAGDNNFSLVDQLDLSVVKN